MYQNKNSGEIKSGGGTHCTQFTIFMFYCSSNYHSKIVLSCFFLIYVGSMRCWIQNLMKGLFLCCIKYLLDGVIFFENGGFAGKNCLSFSLLKETLSSLLFHFLIYIFTDLLSCLFSLLVNQN